MVDWGVMKRSKTFGFQLTDPLWEKLQGFLPQRINTHRFGGGRPPADDRRCLAAIFFVLRTGCQWKALDATGLVPGSTAHDRFQFWRKAGVFRRMWQAGLHEYDRLRGLDWAWLATDGSQIKAPLAGEKNRPQSDRPGQARHQTQSGGGGGGRAGGSGR